jgi:hypothetical protein
MEASTLIDPRVAEAALTVVPVVAHGPLEHGTFETVENGRTVTRCKLYRNLECAEHQATHEGLKPYQGTGRFRIPFTVWIDPEGNKLFRRDGWRRPDEFLYDIRLAIEKVKGPSLTRAEYFAIIRPLDEAKAALAARRFALAAAKFESIRSSASPDARAAAEAGLGEIRATGATLLAAAKAALKGGRIRQARPALDELAREFGAFDSGREAVKLFADVPCPLRELTLKEGPSHVYLRGDGAIWIRLVEGNKERRFHGTLDAASWDGLGKAIQVHDPNSAMVAAMWSGVPVGVADYKEWLNATIGRIARGKPEHEGDFDPAWRPDGFAK